MKRKATVFVVALAAIFAVAAWGASPVRTGVKSHKWHKKHGYARSLKHFHVPASALKKAAATAVVPLIPTPADPIVNGGFEADPFALTGWNVVDWPDSYGTWLVQSGDYSPISGAPVAPPPEGNQAAMADEEEPASSVLFQDFVVPPASVLTFQMAYYNWAEEWDIPVPATLDQDIEGPNQQIRVDIMDPAADPFDVGPGVLKNIFIPTPGSTPYYSDYKTYGASLGEFSGQFVRLRFEQTDNQFYQQLGVDDVKILPPDLSFMDDSGASQVCLNSTYGAFQWTILSGPNAGRFFPGTLSVYNGGTMFWSQPGASVYVYVYYDPNGHTAWGYLYDYTTGTYVSLFDSNTLDDPQGCQLAD